MVEDRVRDLVRNLVGMAFRDGLGREERGAQGGFLAAEA
jgi:hypothetical protein